MTERTIMIPDREAFGTLIGAKKITVDWTWPKCGDEMGEPKLIHISEDGVSCKVHEWKSPCGHICYYQELSPKSILPIHYRMYGTGSYIDYENFKKHLRKKDLSPSEYQTRLRHWCDLHGY